MDYSQFDPEDMVAAWLVGFMGQEQIKKGELSEEQFASIFNSDERPSELVAALDGSYRTIGLIGAYMVTVASLGMGSSQVFSSLLARVFELGWQAARESDDWDELLGNL